MSDAVSTGKLQIASVVRQIFAVLGRNAGPFSLLALLFSGVPSAMLLFLQPGPGGAPDPGVFFKFAWVLPVMWAGELILQTVLIHATLQDLEGRPVSISDSFGVGLRVFLPALGLVILMALGIMAGMILLIVPGIMIALAWIVVIPSFLNEPKVGVMGAFGRSAQLTRGNRWRIFGLVMLFFVVLLVFQMVVGGLGAGGGVALGAGSFLSVIRILSALINVASSLLVTVGAAVLYVELRKTKEGFGAAGLAAVFD